MNSIPRQKLKEIVVAFGKSLLDDTARCEAILMDYIGNYKKELFLLTISLKEGVAADLVQSFPRLPRQFLLKRQIKNLRENLGLTQQAAQWAVESWALSLEILSEEELNKQKEQEVEKTKQEEISGITTKELYEIEKLAENKSPFVYETLYLKEVSIPKHEVELEEEFAAEIPFEPCWKLVKGNKIVKNNKSKSIPIDMARKEVASLEDEIKSNLSTILPFEERELIQLEKKYVPLRSNLTQTPEKDQFETTVEYKLRVKNHQKKVRSLEKKYQSQLKKIQGKYDSQFMMYRNRIEDLKNMKYRVEGLRIDFIKYNADDQLYMIQLMDARRIIKDYLFSMEKGLARSFYERRKWLRVEGYYLDWDYTDIFDPIVFIDPFLGRFTFEMTTMRQFRSHYECLREYDVKFILEKYNLYSKCVDWNDGFCNPNGNYQNNYQFKTINGDKIVIDYASGVTWCHSGSTQALVYKSAQKWVEHLNRKRYAGYDNWQLPTLEQAASLLERNKNDSGIHIEPIFSHLQRSIWTGDHVEGTSLSSRVSNSYWVVDFEVGLVSPQGLEGLAFVRPVRTGR